MQNIAQGDTTSQELGDLLKSYGRYVPTVEEALTTSGLDRTAVAASNMAAQIVHAPTRSSAQSSQEVDATSTRALAKHQVTRDGFQGTRIAYNCNAGTRSANDTLAAKVQVV